MMNLRSWREIKIMLKWRFSVLSDQDFDYEDAQREKMLDQIAAQLNRSRSDLELLFAELQQQ